MPSYPAQAKSDDLQFGVYQSFDEVQRLFKVESTRSGGDSIWAVLWLQSVDIETQVDLIREAADNITANLAECMSPVEAPADLVVVKYANVFPSGSKRFFIRRGRSDTGQRQAFDAV